MEQKKLLIILSVICSLVFLWSLINPSGYGIWFLEAFPVLVGVPILFFTYKKFKFTNLTYIVIAIHVIILLVGAHYTYAENPLFEWIKNYFDLERNHYDRLGHFFQGFAPILIAREFLLIKTPSTIVVPYLWAVGNLRFLSYIPPHIGQHILGMALPTPVPCIAGIIPMGVGLPIIYHGSSI